MLDSFLVLEYFQGSGEEHIGKARKIHALFLCSIGSRITLVENIWPERGLANAPSDLFKTLSGRMVRTGEANHLTLPMTAWGSKA